MASDTLLVRRGDKINPRLISWLWKPLLAYQEICVWAGLPDAGKGTFAAYAISKITSHAAFDNNFPTPEDRDEVLVLSAEETHDTTTIPRILAMGGDPSKVHFVEGVGGRSLKNTDELHTRMLALKTDIGLLEAHLRNNPRIGLVVIDPIDCYFGGAKKNSAEHVTEIYGNLKTLGEKCNVAVLIIDHLNKNSSQAAIHRVSGAGAAAARPRLVWMFARDKENPVTRHVANMKGNILSEAEKRSIKFQIVGAPLVIEGRETSQACVKWLGNSSESADSLLQVSATKPLGAPPTARAKAEEFLRRELRNGDRLSSDIDALAIQEGIDVSPSGTLHRARQALRIRPYRKDATGPWYLPRFPQGGFFDTLRASNSPELEAQNDPR